MATTRKGNASIGKEKRETSPSTSSTLYKKNLKPGLAVLGNISIGGAIEKVGNFADKATLLSENGAKTVLVPMDNVGEMATLPTGILGKTDVPFYSNTQMLLQKAVLNE